MAASITDIQKIVVTLAPPDVVIEPGNVAQLMVTMSNQQDASDRLFLEVEGIDVEWYAIPVPAVNAAPGEQVSERILFRVARSSENRAGSYPFLVRVKAMETGETGVAQATLEVKPFNALQVELSHKRAVATFFRPLNDFDVNVANLGNSEETLDLYASDPDDGCAYEFDSDRISLKPGQSKVVPLAARPKVMPIVGGSRLFGFTVSARSVDDSYVSANVHGQLETHALISPLLGILFLLLSFGGVAYLMTRPTPIIPPHINQFVAQSRLVREGDADTLSWDVSGTDPLQVIIQKQVGSKGTPVNDPGEVKLRLGSVQVKPELPYTIYTLEVRGPGQTKAVTTEVKVEVKKQPLPPRPVIKTFYADPDKIHPNDPVMLHWDAMDDKGLILDPTGQHFQFEKSFSVNPDKDTQYTLIAIPLSDALKQAERSVKVQVVPANICLAEIGKFLAYPGVVYIGDTVHLKWRTRYAHTIHIDSDQSGAVGDFTAAVGVTDVKVDKPTVFTLTVADSGKLTKTQTITVTPQVKPAPPMPAPSVTPDPSASPLPVTPPQ